MKKSSIDKIESELALILNLECCSLDTVIRGLEAQNPVKLQVCMQGPGFWAQISHRGKPEHLGVANECQSVTEAIYRAAHAFLKRR